jgi:hypothetical protein
MISVLEILSILLIVAVLAHWIARDEVENDIDDASIADKV